MLRTFHYWGSDLGSMLMPTEAELRQAVGLSARWDSEYLDNYILVCPHCGEVWLRSTCEGHTLQQHWSIRERYCFEHGAEHFAATAALARDKLVSGITPFLSAPGAPLSFYGHFHAVGQEQWLLWLSRLPERARRFEIRAWTALDLRVNPSLRINLHGNPPSANAPASSDSSAIPITDSTSWSDLTGSAFADAVFGLAAPQSAGREDHQLRPDGSGQDSRPVDDPAGV